MAAHCRGVPTRPRVDGAVARWRRHATTGKGDRWGCGGTAVVEHDNAAVGVGVDAGRDRRTNTETGARRRHSGGADAGQNGHAVVASG
jgi:hypothetical protein